MKTRCGLFLVLVGVAMFAGGCCGTPHATGMEEPDPAPVVETAGWESHPAAATLPPPAATTAGSAEVDSLRAMNRRLMDQVSRLMAEVQAMKQPAAPAVAEAPAPAAAPAPSMEIGAVRSAVRKSGAGEMSVGLSPEGEVKVTVPGSLCFAAGKADLQTAAREKLAKVFSSLKSDFPGLKVRVEGHTDADPIRKSKWESNEALSVARANAVAGWLVSSVGLPAERVEAVGFGASRPVASNESAAGKAENRRVEIYLIP